MAERVRGGSIYAWFKEMGDVIMPGTTLIMLASLTSQQAPGSADRRVLSVGRAAATLTLPDSLHASD